MTAEPERWSLRDLTESRLGRAVVWASSSVRCRVEASLPFRIVEPRGPAPEDLHSLIVVGGGTLMDEAKEWRQQDRPHLLLVAIPSVWGSGAEVTPIVALTRGSRKEIRIDPALRPDAVVYWPQLAETLPPARVLAACGDTWAHALEGFLSPLADQELRRELADLIRSVLDLPFAAQPAWFTSSARAALGQARSSVGLVHGIAHVLEGPLCEAFPGSGWGHAPLCRVFLRPVMRLNASATSEWSRLMGEFGLDEAAIMERLNGLFDERLFEEALPLLETHWPQVLRDPCTRTNSVVVRPRHLSHFVDRLSR